MRAVVLTEHGGPSVLSVQDHNRPTPGADELLIEVHTASVNPVDTYFRDGSYPPVGLPFTPGVDLAGVVAETGTRVTGFDPGDRVYGAGIGNAEHQGGYAEYATVPTDRVVGVPDGVALAEAGAAGVVAGTAWRSLIHHADLDPTAACLIHGGSGGVGHAAVQIAAAAGARVLTTAAPRYHDRLISLGADEVFDYARDDLAAAVTDAANGGVDVVLDHRLDEYLQFDTEVAAQGARVVGIGENDPAASFSSVGTARSKDVRYQFMSLFNTPDLRAPLSGVVRLMQTGALSIAIDRRYGLAEAAAAQRAVLDESFFGKLVIEP